MKNKILFILLILMLSIMLFSGTYEKKYYKEFPNNSIKVIKITNVNGSIIVETSKNGKITIDAVISGRKKYKVEETNIDVIKSVNSLSIKPDMPNNSNVNISFYLKLPENLKVKVTTVNGKITSDGNFNYFTYTTVNGKILINSENIKGKAKTVNGSIETHIKNGLLGNFYVSTVNGSVRVYIGKADNLKAEAKTVNGSIKINHSDLKVKSKKSFFPFMPRKVIGEGDNPKYRLTISTVNGSVKILNE